MGVIRNFIHTLGITLEEEIPKVVSGPVIQYSEVETIYIPNSQNGIKSVFEIMIDLDISSKKIIKTPIGHTVVIDGMKTFKIVYAANETLDEANLVTVEIPYNTFIEVQGNINKLKEVEVYILDAYFHLLDDRRIYSHILYFVHVNYGENIKITTKDDKDSIGIIGNNRVDDTIKEMYLDELSLDEEKNQNKYTKKFDTSYGHKREDNRLLVDKNSEYL